jgi:hypothetical protein
MCLKVNLKKTKNFKKATVYNTETTPTPSLFTSATNLRVKLTLICWSSSNEWENQAPTPFQHSFNGVPIGT